MNNEDTIIGNCTFTHEEDSVWITVYDVINDEEIIFDVPIIHADSLKALAETDANMIEECEKVGVKFDYSK